ETPLADFAIVATIVSVIQATVEERWVPLAKQKTWAVDPLHEILLRSIRDGENAVIDNQEYLGVFGLQPTVPMTAKQVWQHLVDDLAEAGSYPLSDYLQPIKFILKNGSLSTRITQALAGDPSREAMFAVYERLCACVAEETIFDGRLAP